MNVSVCIPIIRPEKAKYCIDAIQKHAPGVEIVSDVDIDRIGCPKMLKRLVERARHDLICFLGDDTIPQEGFLDEALKAMAELPDGWGLVGLSDETGRELPVHWLADRRILPLLGGEFFSTAYNHCFCDQELMDIAKEHNRYVMCEKAVVRHDHPLITGVTITDPDLQHVYSESTFSADRAMYNERKRSRFGYKLAIGFPLVDALVHVNFFTSFACMEKPSEYTLLVPEFPHGPFVGTLADARNSLVTQSQENGCSEILMLDTDQVYPPNTLTKLKAHKKDICGVRVHRRYPPFDPVFLRGEIGRYQVIPEDEMFSGELVEVDATGTGCLLFNMAIFDKIQRPWFQFDFGEHGPIGEDIYFCSKARAAGLNIYVDTSIEVKHLATIAIDRGMYHVFQALNKDKGGNENVKKSR